MDARPSDTNLLRGEVVLDVERTSDLFGSFALDHVRHCFAGDIEQTFDIEVIRCLKCEVRVSERAVIERSLRPGSVRRECLGRL